ncbi:MAG: MATE family efflux transporter [Clostridium sp.]|nr:MATE family efflux transporter [Clostridium sp.]
MRLDARPKGLNRTIWAIAVPAIVTNLTTPLLGLCDVAIAGHRGGAPFIAALAVATSVFNMLYWLFGFLRMGSSGMTAQAYGAADRRALSLVLWRALTVAATAGVMILIFSQPLTDLILDMLDVHDQIRADAWRYCRIVVWGAPAVLSTFALTGWFLGMQNSKVPMVVSLLADVSNIAISLGLVFGLGLRIEGVALGTLSAQWLSFIVGLTICLRRFRPARQSLREILRWNELKRFTKVNTDIFLRTVCLVAVTMWFTRAGASQGEVMLSVNSMLMQFFTLLSYFLDGFAFSAEALVGRYTGAADHDRRRRIIRLEFLNSFVVALLFSAFYFFGGDWLMCMLTDDGRVIDRAREYLPWMACIPLAGFMAFCCDGIYIGATETRRMLAAMILAMAVFFGLYFLLFPALGNHGLWIAFLGYLLTRGLTLTLMLRRLPAAT